MNEKLLDALDELSDRYILQAVTQKKRRRRLYLRAAAAVLALALLCLLLIPGPAPVSAAELVSPAAYSSPLRPDRDDYADEDAWWADMEVYLAEADAREETVDRAAQRLRSFWKESFPRFLRGEENTVWSPVNTWLALATLAQTASGSTRQEILDALNAPSAEVLSQDVRAVWEYLWLDKEHCSRKLSNSLWLDRGVDYHMENLKILGTDYHASAHLTDLNHPAADEQIAAWIDRQTGGLLSGSSPAGSTGPGLRVLTLVSTAWVSGQWQEPFKPENNTEAIFHAPGGDENCTYLNALIKHGSYHRGEDYSMLSLDAYGATTLWLVLPDEDSSIDAVAARGAYLDAILSKEDLSARSVRLTMPKFDISASLDLTDGLRELGIREVFSRSGADFSGTFSSAGPIYADSIRQSARIIADESGIQAGSATRVDIISKSLSIEGPVELVLDRPFLFVLTSLDFPIFSGVVAQP